MEVVVKEITIVEVSKETFIEIALEEIAFGVVNLIISIIYYSYSYNKRSIILILIIKEVLYMRETQILVNKIHP